MRLNNFFAKHPVFTLEDIAQFYASPNSGTSEPKDTNKGTLKALLAYHQRQGHIVSIRRGLYYSIPTCVEKGSYTADQFLIASKMADDAIISHHAALQLHGVANSVRYEYTFLTSHKDIRPLKHDGCVCKPILQPDALVKTKNASFAVQTLDRLGMSLPVTSLERTLVDVLDRPDLGGGWEEIYRAFEAVTYLQTAVMIEYAKLLNNATTSAKLGFLLDQNRQRLMIADDQIKQLRSMVPRTPHYMDRRKRSNGKVFLDWNLIVPIEILERRWEESL